MADDQVRCFVGIAAADMGLQDLLVERVRHYRGQPGLANIRWTPATFLHLTLCFLGNQPLSVMAALPRQLGDQLSSVAAFEVPLAGCSGFPDAKSRIVAALPVLTPALAALQARVVAAVRLAGVAPESRPYLPHITLGRVMHGCALPPMQDSLDACGVVQAVSLYRSELLPGGSHYDILQRWPLVVSNDPLRQGSPTLG